jgi:uncharacterized protein (UPF0335 family)
MKKYIVSVGKTISILANDEYKNKVYDYKTIIKIINNRKSTSDKRAERII